MSERHCLPCCYSCLWWCCSAGWTHSHACWSFLQLGSDWLAWSWHSTFWNSGLDVSSLQGKPSSDFYPQAWSSKESQAKTSLCADSPEILCSWSVGENLIWRFVESSSSAGEKICLGRLLPSLCFQYHGTLAFVGWGCFQTVCSYCLCTVGRSITTSR